MPSNIVNTQGHADSHHELDLARLLGELIDHRVAILGITLIFVLLGTFYALFASPVYLADAMVQIEDKQQNSILKTLDQLTPTLSSDSSAEIQILKSRMILGKTVEALRLRDEITQVRLPLIGKAWAKLTGQAAATLILDNLTIPEIPGKPMILTLTAEDNGRFLLEGEGINARGTVGTPVQHAGVSITVRELSAPPGTQFKVRQRGQLEVINALSRQFSVTEQGKESGILMLSLTGHDPVQIKSTLNHIMHNYLQQNIARQAAQD